MRAGRHLRSMRTTFLPFAAFAALACSAVPDRTAVPPETVETIAAETATLQVRFRGLEPDRGRLVCALFGDESSFENDGAPRRSAVLPVADADVEWTLELPPGRYAIKVYQDLDEDGELDRGSFGVPSEPYGFSNNARGTFGPPSWAAASFELHQARLELDVDLRP